MFLMNDAIISKLILVCSESEHLKFRFLLIIQFEHGFDISILPTFMNNRGTYWSILQRSALAYRNDSSYEGNLNRISVGITASSTTSRSTSKNSGGLFKGEDYLCSNSTSTSGHAPGALYQNKKSSLAPFAYDSKIYSKRKKKKGEPLGGGFVITVCGAGWNYFP